MVHMLSLGVQTIKTFLENNFSKSVKFLICIAFILEFPHFRILSIAILPELYKKVKSFHYDIVINNKKLAITRTVNN